MKALVLALVVVIVVLGVLIVNSLRHEIAVQKIWQSLKSKSTDTIFTPATIADLPEPVQKYFLNFIAPGTPLPHYVELEMSGNYRANFWSKVLRRITTEHGVDMGVNQIHATADRLLGLHKYTIPAEINAGWWFEKQNYFEFFRIKIEQAKFV